MKFYIYDKQDKDFAGIYDENILSKYISHDSEMVSWCHIKHVDKLTPFNSYKDANEFVKWYSDIYLGNDDDAARHQFKIITETELLVMVL
jgi:hypothetical protein